MTQLLSISQGNWLKAMLLEAKRSFIPDSEERQLRRYDLDWLRVLVFSLLILFHIGMLYVDGWGYHIKSEYLSQELANVMLLVSPWRMACLWLVSGIAIRFVLIKVTMWRYVSVRSVRLLVPLFFAILVIIPPQLYYQMSFGGNLSMSYWQFYQAFWQADHEIFTNYQAGIWPHIDVNHLWYLRALWLYSMLIIPLLPLLNSKRVQSIVNWCVSRHGFIAILLAVLPLFLIQVLNSGDSEMTRKQLGFTCLIYGYIIGFNPIFWQRLMKNIGTLLISFCVCYITLIVFYNMVWLTSDEHTPRWLLSVGSLILSVNRILGVLTVLALASKYLNKNSKTLAYFSEAVYPYYIVHQTIIIIVGYELSGLSLGPVIEPLLVILITFVGCFLSFEIIKRVSILRPLFGLKLTGNYGAAFKRLQYLIAAAITTPLALSIMF